MATCNVCDGEGTVECLQCDGGGTQFNIMRGLFGGDEDCSHCSGTGVRQSGNCGGSGRD